MVGWRFCSALKKLFWRRCLRGEMEAHLNEDEHGEGNRRNGKSRKMDQKNIVGPG